MPVSLLSGLQGTSAWPWPHSAYLAQMHMGKEPRFPDRTDFLGLSLGRSSAFLGPPFFFLENGVVTLRLMSAHTLHKDTVRIGRKAKISRLKSTPGLIFVHSPPPAKLSTQQYPYQKEERAWHKDHPEEGPQLPLAWEPSWKLL